MKTIIRQISLVLLFLLSACFTFGQLPDSADMRISYFGIPSQAPDPDFVKTQTGRINARDAYVNDRVDSLATIVVTDSLVAGAVYYSDTYWEDLRVPMSNTKLNASKSEPALEEMITGVFAYAFEADADSTERLNFIAQLPHNRKAGTDLECHFHWSPSTTNTGNCYWRFTYTIISIDGTFGASTSFRVADAGDGTALKHQLVNLGTIDGASLGISSVLIGNMTRLGESPTDSFTGVAYGLEFDIHYEIDSPGSQEETIKY